MVYHLGQVKGLGYDGKLLIRGMFAPRIRSQVFDNSNRVIGSVSRVFGPIQSPYVSVQPPKDHKPSLDIVGKDVYVRERSG